MSRKVIDELVARIRSSSAYNSSSQVSPHCILWFDKERQWASGLDLLLSAMPELLVLGDYDPDRRTGPAIWIRAELAETSNDDSAEDLPVVYLPGIAREDIRASEDCPDTLAPLVELQFRANRFSQQNGSEWTVPGFLRSGQGGLGLDVAGDTETKQSAILALPRILVSDVELLKGKRLSKNEFNSLLTGGDVVRDLLLWIASPEEIRASLRDGEWKAFADLTESEFGFEVESEGPIAAAETLAQAEGPWKKVWDRFCEAPEKFSGVEERLKMAAMPEGGLFADAETHGRWPQWNEAQETELRDSMVKLSDLPEDEARARVIELDKAHKGRRSLVWSELGHCNLAIAIGFLAGLVRATENKLNAGGFDDLEKQYREVGWTADDFVLKALAIASNNEQREAVCRVVRSVYLPWLDGAARYIQKLTNEEGYPAKSRLENESDSIENGVCYLFVDGLRFDSGKRLASALVAAECRVEERSRWCPLPSVTSTGKPAVSPVAHLISGPDDSPEFVPAALSSGSSLSGGYHFKKLLEQVGIQSLKGYEEGDPSGSAWCEFGDIDHEGHDRGARLAGTLDTILKEVAVQIEFLLDSGWQEVRVVTDHGWLLLPGGLPKHSLSASLTNTKWGRCATLKQGAKSEISQYPWYWNSAVYFALADGVSCFRKGLEYAHGGLSLQECLTPELRVTRTVKKSPAASVFESFWRGLRIFADIKGNQKGLRIDVRLQPGNADSSVLVSPKEVREDGSVSAVVEDDELLGKRAFVVVLDADGGLLGQKETLIGVDE